MHAPAVNKVNFVCKLVFVYSDSIYNSNYFMSN